MKYCAKCGRMSADNTEFCATCGERLTFPPSPPVLPSAPAATATLGDKLPGLILLPLLLFAVIALIAVTPMFSNLMNLTNVTMQAAFTIVCAAGMLLSARAKGPDLSVGATAAFTGVVAALVSGSGQAVNGIVAALVLCMFVGALNGLLTVVARIPSVFVTLGMLTLMRSACYLAVPNAQMPFRDAALSRFMADNVVMLVILLALLGFLYIMLFCTRLGTPIRQKMGMHTKTVDFLAYVAASVLFSLAASFFSAVLASLPQ